MLTSLATILAVVVIGFPLLMFLAQDRLLFFPQPLAESRRAEINKRYPAVGEVVLESENQKLHAWHVKAAPGKPLVIYFGGNAEEVSWTLAERRWPPDVTLVAVNYRGYGRSDGAPGEPELKADALAIHDAVAARPDVDPRRIVVFGRSLGTAVAVHVAAARPVAGVVV